MSKTVIRNGPKDHIRNLEMKEQDNVEIPGSR